MLQGKPVRDLLKAGDSSAFSAIADMARQKVYGAFTIADLSHLEDDPFLLGAESFDYFTLHSQLMGGRFTLRDGVLAAEDSSVSYVMWSAALSPTVSAMASDGHMLARLDRVLDSLRLVHEGLRIEKSGVPFHSYESSRNAQSEVAWISGVSIVLILLLLLWAFRTPVPIVCTLVAIGVAICAALLGTWALFGSIHVFTFVFGTSVIGVSIDYAIHFFTDWKHGTSKNGLDIRRHIFKGLLLGFMTTELSYIALTFAEFPLLRLFDCRSGEFLCDHLVAVSESAPSAGGRSCQIYGSDKNSGFYLGLLRPLRSPYGCRCGNRLAPGPCSGGTEAEYPYGYARPVCDERKSQAFRGVECATEQLGNFGELLYRGRLFGAGTFAERRIARLST